VDEELLVVAESVEGIKDWKVFCLVRIKRRRENDAVRNVARKDFAGNGVAFDPAGGGEEREVKEVEERKEVKERAEVRAVGS